MTRSPQRAALGILFLFLAAAFAGMAYAAFDSGAGGRALVVGGAAAVIAAWLATLAWRALR